MARSANSNPFWSPPQFFKVVIPNVTTQHLRIPSDFVKHISNEESDRAILEGPSDSQWHIKLCKTEHGTFFKDGWQDFVRYYSLGNNEFLIFRYEGNLRFNVVILHKSGCEIEYSSPIERAGRLSRKHDGSTEISTARACQRDSGMEAVAEKMIKPEDIMSSDSESQKKMITEDKDAKLKKSAESFSSVHPYFKIQMAPVHVVRSFALTTPAEFSKKYLPSADAKIILRNPSGNCFAVNFINRKGRRYLAGGWRAFVREAKLKKGDICAFELVGKLEFSVHVFPVGH